MIHLDFGGILGPFGEGSRELLQVKARHEAIGVDFQNLLCEGHIMAGGRCRRDVYLERMYSTSTTGLNTPEYGSIREESEYSKSKSETCLLTCF